LITNPLDLSAVYQPHWGQQVVHNSPAKVKILEVARRWGKSRSGLFELLKTFVEALQTPVSNALVPPFHAWIVCPSFPQSRQTWNELQSLVPLGLIYNQNRDEAYKQDEKVLYLGGNENRAWGMVELKSAGREEALQTVGLDFLWVSEAQDVANEAFEKLMPTLVSAERLGKAVFEGIPSLWPDHWFRRAFLSAQEGREGWESFKYTVYDNPMLGETGLAEIEAFREMVPDRVWRRMYMAEFSEDAGYFSNISACIKGDSIPSAIPGVRYVAGLDLGRKRDKSVLIIMEAQSRRVVHSYAWDSGDSWPLQKASVVQACQDWGIERILPDATGLGGDMFTQELESAGIPVEPYVIGTSQAREDLLNNLLLHMEREDISYPHIPALLRELRSFQYRKTPSGHVRAEAAPGEHDDYVFALALAAWAADPSSGTVNFGGFKSHRYVPNQSEAGSGIRSVGAKQMAERRQQRMVERWQRSGVEV
jgi:hypothetical protein